MAARRWRRGALAVVALSAGLGLPTGDATAATGPVPVLVLEGTGFGHGVGLSQWGAEYMARQGRNVDQILTTFYPGIGLGAATGTVRVAVHAPPTSTTTLTFPEGGEVRSPLTGPQADGFPVRLGPGGRVRVTFDGQYRVEPLVGGRSAGSAATPYQDSGCPVPGLCPTTTEPTTTTTSTTTTRPPAPPPTSPGGGGGGGGSSGGGGGAPTSTTAAPDPRPSSGAPVWAVPSEGGVTHVDERDRAYRGVIEATGGAALRLVNQLGVEDYLRGMQEVPGTWPAAAVQAQTVAARTYALRAMQTGGELCDDQRCQVYVGRGGESAGEDAAVAATAGRVLVYQRRLAAAVYSADAGGVSATTFEGFGTPDGVYPYLTTVRYETDNPLPWRVEVALTDVASRVGYAGAITSVRVGTTGPSARALDLVVSGSKGDATIDGRTFASALGLRSTRFVATIGTSDGAPPPPPAAASLQALPDEAAALAVQPRRPAGPRVERRDRADSRTGLSSNPDVLARTVTLAAALSLAGLTGALVPVALAHPGSATTLVERVQRVRRLRRSGAD